MAGDLSSMHKGPESNTKHSGGGGTWQIRVGMVAHLLVKAFKRQSRTIVSSRPVYPSQI